MPSLPPNEEIVSLSFVMCKAHCVGCTPAETAAEGDASCPSHAITLMVQYHSRHPSTALPPRHLPSSSVLQMMNYTPWMLSGWVRAAAHILVMISCIMVKLEIFNRCAVLHALQASVLYSGSDDSTFKGWDVRLPSSSSADQEPQQTAIFSNRRAHAAGVTCIGSHPRQEHVLVTGSYDEHVRLWDVRMINKPMETCQVCKQAQLSTLY